MRLSKEREAEIIEWGSHWQPHGDHVRELKAELDAVRAENRTFRLHAEEYVTLLAEQLTILKSLEEPSGAAIQAAERPSGEGVALYDRDNGPGAAAGAIDQALADDRQEPALFCVGHCADCGAQLFAYPKPGESLPRRGARCVNCQDPTIPAEVASRLAREA